MFIRNYYNFVVVLKDINYYRVIRKQTLRSKMDNLNKDAKAIQSSLQRKGGKVSITEIKEKCEQSHDYSLGRMSTKERSEIVNYFHQSQNSLVAVDDSTDIDFVNDEDSSGQLATSENSAMANNPQSIVNVIIEDYEVTPEVKEFFTTTAINAFNDNKTLNENLEIIQNALINSKQASIVNFVKALQDSDRDICKALETYNQKLEERNKRQKEGFSEIIEDLRERYRSLGMVVNF